MQMFVFRGDNDFVSCKQSHSSWLQLCNAKINDQAASYAFMFCLQAEE